jgi:hypothetical protein
MSYCTNTSENRFSPWSYSNTGLKICRDLCHKVTFSQPSPNRKVGSSDNPRKRGSCLTSIPIKNSHWVPGVLSPGVKRGRGVTLTTRPHLVPRSRMSRSCTSSSPPNASMACSGTAYLPIKNAILFLVIFCL